MSKKLLSCALLAEPLRGSLLQRKYCNTAEMLKGQGRVPANGGKCSCTGLSYLRQSPAPWQSHLWQNEKFLSEWQNEKFLFQPLRPHVVLNEAQAHMGKPKPPPERPEATLSHQSAGRAGARQCLREAAWLWKWPCWASFLRYMGSRDNTKFTSHPCESFQIQKPRRLPQITPGLGNKQRKSISFLSMCFSLMARASGPGPRNCGPCPTY